MAEVKKAPNVSQGEKDREKELDRREAHKAAVKRAQAESIIIHGPVR